MDAPEGQATGSFRLAWVGGDCSAEYLGRRRWRCRLPTRTLELPGVDEAIGALLDVVFAGVPGGTEASARSPLTVHVGPGATYRLTADARMFNGWSFANASTRGTVGDHGQLRAWLAALMAAHAEALRAPDAVNTAARLAAADFSFASFAADPDPAPRCRRLESLLAERLAASPCPSAVLQQAAMELRSLGHDLWSRDPGAEWGWDYMTRRDGAGLVLTLQGVEDEETGERVRDAPCIAVSFRGTGR